MKVSANKLFVATLAAYSWQRLQDVSVLSPTAKSLFLEHLAIEGAQPSKAEQEAFAIEEGLSEFAEDFNMSLAELMAALKSVENPIWASLSLDYKPLQSAHKLTAQEAKKLVCMLGADNDFGKFMGMSAVSKLMFILADVLNNSPQASTIGIPSWFQLKYLNREMA